MEVEREISMRGKICAEEYGDVLGLTKLKKVSGLVAFQVFGR